MAEFDKNQNEEIEDLGDIIYTLTDEETGEEIERFNGQLHRMPNGDIWRM